MKKQRLRLIEEYIFDLFRRRKITRLLAKEVFESAAEHANADLVRAFEDLEKRQRLLVRFTDEGDDWIQLTPEGAKLAGLSNIENLEKPQALPHPPKSST
jgi:hypothetical protein